MSANWIFSFVSPHTLMSAFHPFRTLGAVRTELSEALLRNLLELCWAVKTRRWLRSRNCCEHG